MYNHVMNEKWADRLRSKVAGKRILMVGNSTTMFSKKYGDFIDSFDFVVRFGKGVPYEEYRDYLGRKTDMWFFGTSRAGCYDKFKHVPFKLYTMAQLHLYKLDRNELAVHRDMLSGKMQVYRDFFLAGDAATTLAASKEINGEINGARISQGAQCIHYFANQIKTYRSIELVGFDFFGSGFKYNYDASSKKNIPKEQPTTSWHMPLVSSAYEGNPHSHNGNEERYIRSVPNLTVHEMPPPDMNKLSEVLLRLRGSKATITGELK